ncbi:LacI family transcriptional regulator [Plantibacter flavus]|uniref:LacI family DNA-binding transcriptional regulator n=1 Tax=Plantibacter flavus TaxID=150123 RepID=UPI003F16E4EC
MVSIHDVAQAAGVSISTVSYALTGKRSITEGTRLRVEEAANALGYRANAGARMLKGARTNLLALSAPLHAGTYAPAHMAFVLGVVNAAREYDYDVVLLTQDDAIDGLRRVSQSSLVDGIVLLDVSTVDERAGLVRELGVPATVIGVPGDTEGLVCVDLDFERAAWLAVERLVALGHRRIACIGQSPAIYERGSNFPPRFRDAFLAACAANGIDAVFEPCVEDAVSVARVIDRVTERLGAAPTALVFQTNEPVQAMALDLLGRRGVRIPEELSVISACSSFETSHLEPALDVIPLPAEQSCARAIALTMRQLDGTVLPHVELIEPWFVEYGSVAGPPAD